MKYLKARLEEGSTFRGLIWIFAALIALHFSDSQAQTMGAVAMLLGGMGGVTTPDKME